MGDGGGWLKQWTSEGERRGLEELGDAVHLRRLMATGVRAPAPVDVLRDLLSWERRCIGEIAGLDRMRVEASTREEAERYGPRRAEVHRLLRAVEAMRRAYDRYQNP